MNGIVVIDKPSGMTSHSATQQVKEMFSASKAGHAGTLDFIATGVLVVCLGRGTLLSGYLSNESKDYLVTILLGVETNTMDIEGKVTKTRDSSCVGIENLRSVVTKFLGEQTQRVPSFSAAKFKGRPLYYYARKGEVIKEIFKNVEIYQIDVVSVEKKHERVFATLFVSCSPGTYIRSLAHDIGSELGCGACVYSLRRIRSGSFTIDRAMTLHELASLDRNSLNKRIVSLEDATQEMPSVTIFESEQDKIAKGKPLTREMVMKKNIPNHIFRVMSPDGRLIALYTRGQDENASEIVAIPKRVIRPAIESKKQKEHTVSLI
ncbi:MAG: tRNA pseudouridine(55) synthase TruB [Actinomycetota bacterium]|nr:tRNA pseudouridine(55) synthase TruB [Actinomycetota bacterium]